VTVNDQDPYSVEAMDSDPEETSEWAESLDALVADKGHQRAREIMLSLLKRSKELHLGVPMVPTTDYLNTIAPENEPAFPGDEEIERRYRAWIRWNAAMLVRTVCDSDRNPVVAERQLQQAVRRGAPDVGPRARRPQLHQDDVPTR